MSKISVYLNDRASGANIEFIQKSLEYQFKEHHLVFKKKYLIEEIPGLITKDENDGIEYIFAAGGDGTINTLIQSLTYSKMKLFIIPVGTANDLAYEFGITKHISELYDIFNKKSHREIDLISVNGKFMATNGGIGLTSIVALKVNTFRDKFKLGKEIMNKLGAWIYPLFLAKEILSKSRFYDFVLESPDYPELEKKRKSLFIMINNQAVIGGKFTVAPYTRNNDDKFNVLIFEHRNKLAFIKDLLNLMKGKDVSNNEGVLSFETSYLDLSVIGNEGLNFFGDGEVLDSAQNYIIKTHHKAVQVCSNVPEYIEDHLINQKVFQNNSL